MAGLAAWFARDERGNVAIIVALLLLPMLVLAGGATDIARYEAHRAQLQDGIDRGVLAAASLSQTVRVEKTVEDYLKTLPFLDAVTLDFDYALSLNVRSIKVSAQYEMPTGFLPLIGINSLPMTVSAGAEERRSNLEISLMLDMSGSMRYSEPAGAPTRISLLRPAAKAFIDAMLSPESMATTTISIVPYAGSVNPGATAFRLLGVPRQHERSSCVEFVAADYTNPNIAFTARTQLPHFTQNHTNQNDAVLGWPWCPEEVSAITYLSNNAATLKARIDALKMFDGTGTAIGTNWGLLLLDPVQRPFVAKLAGADLVNNAFAGRPSAFNDPNTLKVIVLMTDGDISAQFRPKQYAYPRNPEGSSGNTERESRTNARDRLYQVCNRAKANGVVVFTIGFQLTATGQTEMRNCATSESHFHNVQGLDIAGAFRSVATAIQKVRLTQ